MKQIVKDLEQTIFGYNDDKSKEELEAEELERRFNKLKNNKNIRSRKIRKKFENLKNKRLVKERIDALRKRLKYIINQAVVKQAAIVKIMEMMKMMKML